MQVYLTCFMKNSIFPKRNYNMSGHAHELTFSCYRKRPYFTDANVCEIFIRHLSDIKTKYDLKIWAYVIMPTHIHVLLWPSSPIYDISLIQKELKGRTAKQYADYLKKYFPERYEKLLVGISDKRVFRVWQRGGGFDRNMWKGLAVHNAIKYIEGNPVRSGLARMVDEWKYSSAYARFRQTGLIPDKFMIPVL